MDFYGVYPAAGTAVVVISGPVSVTQGTVPWVVSGTVAISNFPATVAVTQSTSPWVVSGTVAATQSGTWTTGRTWVLSSGTDSVNVGNFPSSFNVVVTDETTNRVASGSITSTQTVTISTLGMGTVTADITGTWTGDLFFEISADGTTWRSLSGTDIIILDGQALTFTTYSSIFKFDVSASQKMRINGNVITGTANIVLDANQADGVITSILAPVYVSQYTSPWVVSGTVTATLSYDENYGTVGAATLRTAAQIGNATGAALFGAGTTTGQVLRVVLPTDQTAIPVSQSGTWNIGTLTTITNPVTVAQPTAANLNATVVGTGTFAVQAAQSGTWTVQQGAPPWSVSQSGAWTTGRTWVLSSGTDSVNVGNFPATVAVTQSTSPWVVSGTVTANQGTSPWVVSGTVTATLSYDENYGTVGASTLRAAAQIGNATGAALFGAGTTTGQVLRVVLPTDQTAIPVTQSGTWTVQPGNTPNTSPWLMTIQQNSNTANVSANNDLQTNDGLKSGGVYGNLVLTTANTSYQVKVGSGLLANRKLVTMQAVDADMYWGYDTSVTTSTGTLLANGGFVSFSCKATGSFDVWLVCASSAKNARITESA